jgi:4-hydroxybenzoate polyprenyltransferase
MLKRLVEISRPVLWVNTIGTTVMAMWLGGDLWRWDIIPFLIWVTFPFNLLIYGINDIFDQETDNINARKGGMEGAKISPSEVRPIFIGVALTNIPFLIYFAFTVPIAAMGWILAYSLFSTSTHPRHLDSKLARFGIRSLTPTMPSHWCSSHWPLETNHFGLRQLV